MNSLVAIQLRAIMQLCTLSYCSLFISVQDGSILSVMETLQHQYDHSKESCLPLYS